MHHCLLLGQNLWLGRCVLGRSQQAATLQPTGNRGGISHGGVWPSYREAWARFVVGMLSAWDQGRVSLCLCCDWAAKSFPLGGGS